MLLARYVTKGDFSMLWRKIGMLLEFDYRSTPPLYEFEMISLIAIYLTIIGFYIIFLFSKYVRIVCNISGGWGRESVNFEDTVKYEVLRYGMRLKPINEYSDRISMQM
jgi:hypothetical protein